MPPGSTEIETAAVPSGIVAAIPARYGSSRLPGKALLRLAGRPMIEHVYRRVRQAAGVDRVVVLTDDERIGEVVSGLGGEWEMTPGDCASGTDRIAWAARAWDARGVVNVQGDEPLVDPQAVAAVARHLASHPEDPMVTVAATAGDEILDLPHVVKVVVDRAGYALYFSRAGIPYPRHAGICAARRHVGLYGYQAATLQRLAALAPTPLERSESLEQLRALEHGIRIRVLPVAEAAPGVDTEADLEYVEEILRRRGANG